MGSFYFPSLFENDYNIDDEDDDEDERTRRKYLDSISGLYNLEGQSEKGDEDLLTDNIDDLYRSHMESSAVPSRSSENSSDFRKLYSSPTGAMEMYKEYLSRKPKFDDGWEMGILNAILGPQIAGADYNRRYNEWKDEGKFIDDMARTLDADRAREIKAIEFDTRQRASSAIQDRLRENTASNIDLRRDTLSLSEEDKAERNADRDADRAERIKDRAERNADRDADRADRLAARAESKADKDATKADKAKPSPSEQKTANDLVDQHIYRSKPDLFEFEDDYGKPLSKPRFIGNEVDATNLMAVRRNLLRKVLSGGVL